MDLSINTNVALDHFIQLSHAYYLIPMSGITRLTKIVSVDPKKALDTKLLLEKLAHYGIKNVKLRWFATYLTNRQQFCKEKRKLSSTENFSCGAPPGSCLGPLLFLLCINDMQCLLTKVKVNVYADVTEVINSELENLKEWLHGNTVYFNIYKNTSMIIGTKHMLTNENGEQLLTDLTIDG